MEQDNKKRITDVDFDQAGEGSQTDQSNSITQTNSGQNTGMGESYSSLSDTSNNLGNTAQRLGHVKPTTTKKLHLIRGRGGGEWLPPNTERRKRFGPVCDRNPTRPPSVINLSSH